MTTDGPLYEKFQVQRTDGTDGKGMKHDACEYFVLDLTHDPYSADALNAYAIAARHTHPQLSAELRLKAQDIYKRIN